MCFVFLNNAQKHVEKLLPLLRLERRENASVCTPHYRSMSFDKTPTH